MTTTIKKLEGSRVEITGTIPVAVLEKERRHAVEEMANSVKIDGFRQGKIPEAVLIQKFGEMTLLSEMAEHAIAKLYPGILREHEVEALGRPDVKITKLAPGNPVEYVITTAVMPEVTLPDYKKIAKTAMTEELESVLPTEKEIEDVVLEIKKMRTDKETGEAPELDDAFVQSIGTFTDVADFKAKITENIKLEKEIKQRDKRRATTLERIAEATKTELPEVLVTTELERMFAKLKGNIEHSGGNFDAYLEEHGKTEDDIKRELRPAAEKRTRFELVLKNIGKAEKLEVDEADVDKEAQQILTHYKGADPERVDLYVEGLLMNEKVLQFLEAQK